MAHAARCGDGVIVLLAQGDPPHPKQRAPSLRTWPTNRSEDRLNVSRLHKSDQARSSQTVTPTTTNMVDQKLTTRHSYIIPAN